MSAPETTACVATLVPEHRRETFLPTLFGLQRLIIAENTLYNLMGWLSPRDYGGGFWDFYELEGKPLYLVPTSRPRYRIACDTNSYEGDVSADAAGIIATLFTFSHLSFKYQSDHLAEGYNRLYAFAAAHAEAPEIFQAID
ncbi:antirestriction protein [Brucella pseudogrignonensis]|uniref:Antirestriction protein n=1 Tax=Brucella pseudogrignonensis TaxID=419475 RepID=A0A7Y3WVF9_9HYPH|nr:antirestriction protein [Brucella pseudogrignonensis]MCM0752673.1 antirestriction protein [Brucella pseudogrignonensis]NNV19139.1 antirestriction protein [Brucella pseudogrignonensis]